MSLPTHADVLEFREQTQGSEDRWQQNAGAGPGFPQVHTDVEGGDFLCSFSVSEEVKDMSAQTEGG